MIRLTSDSNHTEDPRVNPRHIVEYWKSKQDGKTRVTTAAVDDGANSTWNVKETPEEIDSIIVGYYLSIHNHDTR